MAKTRPPYAPEYRRQMVELIRSGRSAGELAREFGRNAQTNFIRRHQVQQNKLFVGNLAFSATQSDVEALFSPYGSLDEVRLVMNRDTGQSRGFAFVTFSAQKDAESALAMNGKPLNGRNLVVNITKEKPRGRGGRGGSRRY